MTSLPPERRRTRLVSSCRSDLLRVSTALAMGSLLCGPLATAAGNVSGRLCCWRRGADVWVVFTASVPPLLWVSEGTATAKAQDERRGREREDLTLERVGRRALFLAQVDEGGVCRRGEAKGR